MLISDCGGLGPRALLLTLGLGFVGGLGSVRIFSLEIGTGLLVGGMNFASLSLILAW